jgi:hypothetical protein
VREADARNEQARLLLQHQQHQILLQQHQFNGSSEPPPPPPPLEPSGGYYVQLRVSATKQRVKDVKLLVEQIAASLHCNYGKSGERVTAIAAIQHEEVANVLERGLDNLFFYNQEQGHWHRQTQQDKPALVFGPDEHASSNEEATPPLIEDLPIGARLGDA